MALVGINMRGKEVELGIDRNRQVGRTALRAGGLALALLTALWGVQRFLTEPGRNRTAPARAGQEGAEAQPSLPGSGVLTGIEVLRAQQFAPLKGKRVGLITNPTGVDRQLRSTVDILAQASGVQMVALYGPEHGVRGDVAAGSVVGNSRDPVTGIPVYSLYGKTRKPTKAMLNGVETLVFDLQDIGARSYTYISTLGLCMEAAAENRIPFVVLDRPNPVGGNRVEGNIPEPGYRSFIGRYPLPYVYGLTLGELAQMLNGEGMLEGGVRCDLTVIPMQGWRRDMTWAETGLPWVLTSPHIPHAETALFYSATGMLSGLSNGVGYTLPFELAGAPELDSLRLAKELSRRNLPGVTFRSLTYTPYYAAYPGKSCGGVQLHITDPAKVALTRLNFEIMDAVRALDPKRAFFSSAESARMFDLACGTDRVRQMFQSGKSAADLWTFWNSAPDAFRARRKPYLLYP